MESRISSTSFGDFPAMPRRVEVGIAEQLVIVDDARGQTAAFSRTYCVCRNSWSDACDAEEVLDRELVRVLALDLDLDRRAVERLGEVAGQERAEHHDDEDRQRPPSIVCR